MKGHPGSLDLPASILAAWRTNNRVTMEFIRSLPKGLWSMRPPEIPTRTVRSIAAHLHNARCSWLKTLGREHGISVPKRVDHHRVTPRQLLSALRESNKGMEALLALGLASGGTVPPSKGYIWRNLALDVGHVLTYFVGHEAHHRGQIIMIARQTGYRIPRAVAGRLWWWRGLGKR